MNDYNNLLTIPHRGAATFSSNRRMRYLGSSGGSVSALVECLFRENIIDGFISLKRKGVFFEPIIIRDYKNYINPGSVYHDVDLFEFVADNIKYFGKNTLLVCSPCQSHFLKKLFKKNKKKVIVISFVCSAQMSRKATSFLFDYLNIRKDDVVNFRYRGGGWPSGVTIETKKRSVKIPNLGSVWTDIFHSGIFTLDKCFFCKKTFDTKSDLIVADPWMKKYLEKERKGVTVLIPSNKKGKEIFDLAVRKNFLNIKEYLSKEEIFDSQKETIKKKKAYNLHQRKIYLIRKIFKSKVYINYIFKNFHKEHSFYFTKYIKYLYKKL